ncbi:tetratricopeptide repeat protein [uncultured Helicobacter sp.]|uniref:tetratricopeptide repeat protein n=1 Tax=uncultured Helicobacter sp. TaxID=175537 RepID=UPI00374F614C
MNLNIYKILFSILLAVNVVFGAFDEEEYMFRALDLQDQGKVQEARDTYLVLYDETKKLEYLKESILLSTRFEQPNIVLSYIRDYKQKAKEGDLEIDKALLDVYIKTNNPTEALPIAQAIARQEDTPMIHNILGVIYASLGDLPKAIGEFESLYEQTQAPEALQKLVILYGQTQQYQKSVELLDSYLQNNVCEGDLCAMAIQIYAKAMQGDKLESLFKKRYNEEPTIANAQNLIYIYSLRKKYSEALKIASRYPFDPKLLFNLYAETKDYSNAYKTALDVYKNSKEAMYLGFAQLYRFETLPNKTNPKEVLPVLQDMQKAIELIQKDGVPDSLQKENLGLFYNFTGFLLIDLDLDIEQGIAYVKKALEIAPNDVAYLDSLAWGYYKKKYCKKAKEVFAKIPKESIPNDEELVKHARSLDLCQ